MSPGVLLVTFLIVIGLVATWWDVSQVLAQRRQRRDPAHAVSPPVVAAVTLEGVLARQVMGHQITTAQYRRAMRSVADRDDGRHPLDLPPDLRPPQML
ncbi:hypothetical protein [Kineosporia sp. NBRC 101731]|uniref:hypothetical protein n=1 Tax=Kineosporia sp. NBRC 101731 TaxID=3032199 RepID=UPI0025544DE1|nr:hypothetical protein [Kineosporia sp. NBRC 101731]